MIDSLQKKYGKKNVSLINNIIIKEINRTNGSKKDILMVSIKDLV
jgi:hypothetical protein